MEPTETQSPKSPTLTFVVGLVGLALFTVITFLLLRYYKQPDTYDASRAQTRAATLVELRKSVDELKGTYTYVDKAAGTVRLPVTRAMELVLADLQTSKPRPSGVKVPPPIVLPAPDAAAAAPAPTDAAAAPAPAQSPADQPGSLFPAPATSPVPITPAAPVAPSPTPGGVQP